MKALFIDIGSNTIRAMTAESDGSAFIFSQKSVYTTRLAAGLDFSGALSPSNMNRSLEVLSSLSADAEKSSLPVFGYATSAVRDASNGDCFVEMIRARCGWRADVLSGAQEAAYEFSGAAHGVGALLDVGGGSAQIITASGLYSAPCGCVRAKDHTADCAPAEMRRTLSPWLDRVFAPPAVLRPEGWTGVGGTITTLAAYELGLERYDSTLVSGFLLTSVSVRDALERLYALGERRLLHPLLSARHDVILPGGTVLQYIMERRKIDSIRVSDADGLEGYAIKMLQRMMADSARCDASRTV